VRLIGEALDASKGEVNGANDFFAGRFEGVETSRPSFAKPTHLSGSHLREPGRPAVARRPSAFTAESLLSSMDRDTLYIRLSLVWLALLLVTGLALVVLL
jgi:hypothetical protein